LIYEEYGRAYKIVRPTLANIVDFTVRDKHGESSKNREALRRAGFIYGRIVVLL